MYCTKCGKQIAPNVKFCTTCGASMTTNSNATSTNNNVYAQTQTARQPAEKRNIIDNFFYVLKNWSNFSGRASRREYWYFILLQFILKVILRVLAEQIPFFAIAELIFNLVVIVTSLSVAVRRLHDVGKSGWWWFIIFTIIGILYFFYLTVTPSNEDNNEYGHNPNYTA